MGRILEARRFDLVIFDVMLPGEDGLSIARGLRAQGQLPVIIVSAKGDEVDWIVGLEIGADDYLGKPFNPRHLLARIRAVLRRRRLRGEQEGKTQDSAQLSVQSLRPQSGYPALDPRPHGHPAHERQARSLALFP